MKIRVNKNNRDNNIDFDNITSYKFKSNDETFSEFRFRLCSNKKEYNLTWQEIADIIYKEFNIKKSEDAYRKYWKNFCENSSSEQNDHNDSLSNLSPFNQKSSDIYNIQKERYKLQATKIELNRHLRQSSRFELLYENIRDEIKALSVPELCVTENTGNKENDKYVLAISDIHYGAQYTLKDHTYSRVQCRKRFEQLLSKLTNVIQEKKINKIMAFAIAFTMLFASQVTAFAATTSSKTVTSSKAMSVALLPGVTGNSNTITFNFNSLPDKAIVKEVEIDCSNASVIGGKGAILAKSLTITSPSGETHTVSWGKGNVTTTNLFIAEKAAGTWSVYMTGTNIASPNLGSAFIGGTKYSSVKMKVSYILED